MKFSRYNRICKPDALEVASQLRTRYCVARQFPLTNGDGEIRTLDPLLARQVLSQLSYTPILIWQPPAFPYRLQYSIIGRLSLNHRVRDVDGCFP